MFEQHPYQNTKTNGSHSCDSESNIIYQLASDLDSLWGLKVRLSSLASLGYEIDRDYI